MKETLARSTFDPCHEDWDFFASIVCPGHHNPYRVASRGRVVRLWGNRANATDSHAACLSAHLYASTPPVVAVGIFSEDLSRTLVVETPDEIVHHVSEHTCPHLVEHRNRLEAVAHESQMPCGHVQGVLAGGEVTVCRRRVSRSRALGVSQTCR